MKQENKPVYLRVENLRENIGVALAVVALGQVEWEQFRGPGKAPYASPQDVTALVDKAEFEALYAAEVARIRGVYSLVGQPAPPEAVGLMQRMVQGYHLVMEAYGSPVQQPPSMTLTSMPTHTPAPL